MAWQAEARATKGAGEGQPPVNSGPSSGSGFLRGPAVPVGAGNASGHPDAAPVVSCWHSFWWHLCKFFFVLQTKC